MINRFARRSYGVMLLGEAKRSPVRTEPHPTCDGACHEQASARRMGLLRQPAPYLNAYGVYPRLVRRPLLRPLEADWRRSTHLLIRMIEGMKTRRLFDGRPEEADLSNGLHELGKIDGLPEVGAEAVFIKMD
jgi:hypothetical protein